MTLKWHTEEWHGEEIHGKKRNGEKGNRLNGKDTGKRIATSTEESGMTQWKDMVQSSRKKL